MICFASLIKRLESKPIKPNYLIDLNLSTIPILPIHHHHYHPPFTNLTTGDHDQNQQFPFCRTTILSNFDTVFLALKSAKSVYSFRETTMVHGFLVVSGYHPNDITLGAQLVNMYVNSDELEEALCVFHGLPTKTIFAWNSVMKGFLNNGLFEKALEFYHLMIFEGLMPDNFTFPCVLKACSGLSDLQKGRNIHGFIRARKLDPNAFVECALIDMYARCGSLGEARSVFEEMTQRDLVSWSAMIGGYVQSGNYFEAFFLFVEMVSEGMKADSVILATILPSCGRMGALLQGKSVHDVVVKSGFERDLCVMNSLIDMYCKCGSTDKAKCVFENVRVKDVISWSTMIAGYSQNCEYGECLQMYTRMSEFGIMPNSVTIASLLPAFSAMKMFTKGKEIHNFVIRHGFEFDVFIGCGLIDMYARCELMREAETVFEILLKSDIAIWNSMIAGYIFNGNTKSAFELLRRMKMKPNSITLLSIIPLCTRLAMVRQGREIHGFVMRSGFESTVSIGNSLMDMYCKSGHLELGVKVFELMEKDTVSYNTIIGALGMHGNVNLARAIFNQMLNEGIKPDKVTFVALLSACSHAGTLDQGWSIYNSMTKFYGIAPDMEHYACMVDLLGRLGLLNDALGFIKNMPVEPDIDVLGSFLAACRVHKDIELAENIARKIFDMFPKQAGYYVLLCNVYATAGKWDDERRVRAMIKQRGLIKEPGCSWIQIKGSLHSFLAKDTSNPLFTSVSHILQTLLLIMKDEGYVADLSFVLFEPAADEG